METIPYISPPVLNTLVFMALGHRILQLPDTSDESTLRVLRTRMYDHRGKAIQAIHSVLDDERLRDSDFALTLVLTLLFGELRQTASPTWAQHFEGASKMIELRGGLKTFLDHPALRGQVDYFLILGVIANTTTPPSAQLTLTSQASIIDTAMEYYGNGLSPSLMCPPALYMEIMRINVLRAQGFHSEDPSSLESDASELVQRIDAFKPQTWATTQTTKYGSDDAESWLLLARVYHSAVTLFAITSLQSLAILRQFPHFDATLSEHRDSLVTGLRKAVLVPEIKMWMMWALVVAGLQAGPCDAEVRLFVKTELGAMARALGTPLPLVAIGSLDRFWRRGGGGWDECFESGFAFVT